MAKFINLCFGVQTVTVVALNPLIRRFKGPLFGTVLHFIGVRAQSIHVTLADALKYKDNYNSFYVM